MASPPAVPYFTVSDLTARFGVSRSTLYRWLRYGYLPPPVRLGPRTVRSSAAALAAFEERPGIGGRHDPDRV